MIALRTCEICGLTHTRKGGKVKYCIFCYQEIQKEISRIKTESTQAAIAIVKKRCRTKTLTEGTRNGL